MNCHEAEALLAALAAGDLGREEAAEVERHAASCAACRESLAAWLAIEEALLARRNEVPPASRTIAALAPALRRKRWTPLFDRIFSVPAMSSFLMVLAAVIFRIGGGSVASALGRMHLFGTRVFAALVGGIDSATGWLGSIGPVELVAWTVGLSAFLVIAATATIVGLLRD
ncbi:MAG: zf-HC2 domain-containing protein [Candidatus Krumholzibacteriota bacterium]|nr:zf-HC2 domain-containing protein [Candidatus Krumholzibacteriota bacterium]